MSRHYNVLGSDPKEVAKMMRDMYRNASYTHIHDVGQWIDLPYEERTRVLFTDTEWYKENRALTLLVTKHFKRAMKNDPKLIDADAMAAFMPNEAMDAKVKAPNNTAVYSNPQNFITDLLPTLTKDLIITEAITNIVPGEAPSITLTILIPKKNQHGNG